VQAVVRKFLADRGTHLAAMIAYFAILAFVPLLFLALSLIALAGEQDESSYLIEELQRAFPKTSIDNLLDVVTEIQDQAAELSVIGGIGLIWAALGFFSVLESAFNIVYGRPNRPFLRGKGVALLLLLSTLVTLFAGLLAGSFGAGVLRDQAPGFIGNDDVASVLSVAVSSLTVFLFLVSVYYLLTNVRHAFRSVLPGGVVATVLLEASFQLLPLYGEYAQENRALQIGTPAVLIVWLFLMSNVIVFGAEINWWWAQRGRGREAEEVPGLA
jgi:membrane protein